MKRDTPKWIPTEDGAVSAQVLCLKPAAQCHQLEMNATGNALASLDPFGKVLCAFVIPRDEWKATGKQPLGFAASNHPLFVELISTFRNVFSVRERKHTSVLSVIYQSPNHYQGKRDRKWILPTTSWCFRWFGGQTIVTALKRDCVKKSWKWKMTDFPLKLQRVVMVA